MKNKFVVTLELEDWSAEELVDSLKKLMPFTTQDADTIKVDKIEPYIDDLPF